MYIYQAECYCDDCGEEICGEIQVTGLAPENPEEQTTYDSSDYPKDVGRAEDQESDTLDLCGRCRMSLGNSLTSDGVAIVLEHLREYLILDEGVGMYIRAAVLELGEYTMLDLDNETVVLLARAKLDHKESMKP